MKELITFREVRMDKQRLVVEITDEQKAKLNHYIPHGLLKIVFGFILDDLLEMLDKHGAKLLGAVLARKIKLQNIIRLEDIDGDNKES